MERNGTLEKPLGPGAPHHVTLRPQPKGLAGRGHPGWSATSPAYPQGRGGRSYWERGRPRPHSGHSPHHVILRPTQCHPEAATEGSGGARHPGWSATRPSPTRSFTPFRNDMAGLAQPLPSSLNSYENAYVFRLRGISRCRTVPLIPHHVILRPTPCHPEAAAEGSGGAGHPGWSATRPSPTRSFTPFRNDMAGLAQPLPSSLNSYENAYVFRLRGISRCRTVPLIPHHVILRPTPCHPEAAAEGSGGAGHPGWSATSPAYPQGRGGVPTGSAGVPARIPGTRNSGGAPLPSSLNSYEMRVAFTSWGVCG